MNTASTHVWLAIAIACILLTGAAPVLALDVRAVALPGELGQSLAIFQDDDAGTLRVELLHGAQMVQAVEVGNAAIEPRPINAVQLCPDCEPVVLVRAYDRSSTYAAETGVLAWRNGYYWSLALLPFEHAELRDEDGNGLFELVNAQPEDRGGVKHYDFRSGMLREASE